MMKFEVTLPLDHVQGLLFIAEKEQLSIDAVIRRALLNYRLIVDGTHKLVSKDDICLDRKKIEELAKQCTCYLPGITSDHIVKECKAREHVRWSTTNDGDA